MILPSLQTWVLPVTLGILIAVFVVQKQGTARIASGFGPITAVWFAVLAGIGIWHISAEPGCWRPSTRSGVCGFWRDIWR